MSLQSFKSKFFPQFPVIGPHADIEGELLLSGQKPVGWVHIVPAFADQEAPQHRQMRDLENRLDAAVHAGTLKSIDVVRHQTLEDGTERDYVIRHYCQPGFEKDLEKVAAFNQKAFNGETPDVTLDRDFGDYLGYRKRDQVFFRTMQEYGWAMPKAVLDAVNTFTAQVSQPAYQEQLLKKSAVNPGLKP